MNAEIPSEFAAHVANVPLVDHHVHAAFAVDGPRRRFETALNEGDTDPLPSWFDPWKSQLGFAVQRWCAPVLELDAHATPDAYWARRQELGESEVNRRMLASAKVSTWLLDNGFGSDVLAAPSDMEQYSGASAREIVRLERVGEDVLAVTEPHEYADAFRQELAKRVADTHAVGTKTIIAYRSGFAVDFTRPSDADVARAVARVKAGAEDRVRIDDPTLLVFGIYEAAAQGLPIQFHTGFGDRDLTLQQANPLLLTDLLRQPVIQSVSILLLHCYPFEREAGYLAQAFSNVYMDVGLAVNYVGAQAATVVAHSLELAPFQKVLYSSDAWGPAELHYLGSVLWRQAFTKVVGAWIADGQWTLEQGIDVVNLIAEVNPRRAYQL